ncbi:MAG: peptide deformylase [Patescibacteria group bacterium]|mgnify:CR=1 FL=1
MDLIITTATKKDERSLRTRTVPFDFSKAGKGEVRELLRRMREAMREANGIGLSANQIGLLWRVFVAQVPDGEGKLKRYAIFNPELSKHSKETETLEEGCLSVPTTWGLVERHYRLTLTGQDQNGKRVKIKAWGLLARVFQHEVDHLDGKLFVDRAEKLHRVTSDRETSDKGRETRGQKRQ